MYVFACMVVGSDESAFVGVVVRCVDHGMLFVGGAGQCVYFLSLTKHLVVGMYTCACTVCVGVRSFFGRFLC